MKFNLQGKTAVYKESGELFLVEVISQKEDEWGIKLLLKILENKFAHENDDDELEYYSKDNFKAEFDINGAWDIVAFSDDVFKLHYVNVTMNFRQSAIDAFRRNEKEFYEIWVRKR